MFVVPLLRFLSVNVILICALRTTDGRSVLTTEELQRSFAVAYDDLETAVYWIRRAQSLLPADIVINGETLHNCTLSPGTTTQNPTTNAEGNKSTEGNEGNESTESTEGMKSTESKSIEIPMDCEELLQQGNRVSAVYTILPRNKIINGPFDVYCDMETDGGGWTVIQRRGDFGSPEDYFFKDWNSYKNGFGDIQKDFWIGNDKLFALTSQRAYKLRVDLTDWEKNSKYAVYGEFSIENEAHNYTLHVKGYSGNAGDSLSVHNGAAFSTKDKDNIYRCANRFKGGWWYTDCFRAHLNGHYLGPKHSNSMALGIYWLDYKPNHSLKDVVMMIKPII